MDKVTDLGRQGVCTAINADLRHVTLSSHNSSTARTMNVYGFFPKNRHPKLSWDV